jgi:hypothetical protein
VDFQEVEAHCDGKRKKYGKKGQEEGQNGHDHYMAVVDHDFAQYLGVLGDANLLEHYSLKPYNG